MTNTEDTLEELRDYMSENVYEHLQERRFTDLSSFKDFQLTIENVHDAILVVERLRELEASEDLTDAEKERRRREALRLIDQ